MEAMSHLRLSKERLIASYVKDHCVYPYWIASFYSQPFNLNMIANPMGEACPAHQENISSEYNIEKDADYNNWMDAEKNILFKYWTQSEFGNDFCNVKDNCIYFQTDSYVIRTDKHKSESGIRFPLPKTLDDFIRDCERVGVELYWKEEIGKKYF